MYLATRLFKFSYLDLMQINIIQKNCDTDSDIEFTSNNARNKLHDTSSIPLTSNDTELHGSDTQQLLQVRSLLIILLILNLYYCILISVFLE